MRSIFLVALGVRLVVALGVAITQDGGGLLLDDFSYSRLAAEAADGSTSGWDAYERFLYERTGALLWPITGLFWVLGPVNFAGQAFVALLGAATAAATVRLGLEFLPRGYAVLAGAIVALLPSQVLWSSLILKDAVVWAMLSGLALVVALAPRGSNRRLALGLLAGALLLLGLAYSRLHTLEIALVALVLSSLAAPKRHRIAQVAATAGIALLLPLAFGMGLGGATFVASSGSLEQRRENNAVGAASAVVDAPPARAPTPQAEPAPPPAATPRAPSTKGPATRAPATRAPSTKAPEAPAPAAPTPELEDVGATTSVSYLPTGLTVIVLRPFPWEAATEPAFSLKLAGLESLLWYPMLIFAAIGLVAVRRHLRVLAFPLLVLGATAVAYALTEGNLGTAYRHRGELVWVVALVASLGLSRVAVWSARRRGHPTGELADP